MARFEIPSEYADQLEVVDVVDNRSDDEILQVLAQYAPVTSEKNIWSFWHSGVANMPGWCQRNATDWVRMCSPEWTVRVLDNNPESPNYILKYLPASLLPEALLQDKMDGPYSGQHSADLVRGAAIYEHGGAWMDVGSRLTRHMDRICWNQLEDPESPYRIAFACMIGTFVENFFVAARKKDPFMERCHRLFLHLWEGRTNNHGMIRNPLLFFASQMDFSLPEKAGVKHDWKVTPEEALEYLVQDLVWMRVAMLEEDSTDKFSGVDYWMNHVYLIHSVTEGWSTETAIGYERTGERAFELLSIPLDGDKTSAKYQEAEKFVWSVLSSSCMVKVARGGQGLFNGTTLGRIRDKPENANHDQEPGTFAELLRYGSLHFRQKREAITTAPLIRPPVTFKKGLMEV